jgi:hypothetical protein
MEVDDGDEMGLEGLYLFCDLRGKIIEARKLRSGDGSGKQPHEENCTLAKVGPVSLRQAITESGDVEWNRSGLHFVPLKR